MIDVEVAGSVAPKKARSPCISRRIEAGPDRRGDGVMATLAATLGGFLGLGSDEDTIDDASYRPSRIRQAAALALRFAPHHDHGSAGDPTARIGAADITSMVRRSITMWSLAVARKSTPTEGECLKRRKTLRTAQRRRVGKRRGHRDKVSLPYYQKECKGSKVDLHR
jgi:hypothetical protein